MFIGWPSLRWFLICITRFNFRTLWHPQRKLFCSSLASRQPKMSKSQPWDSAIDCDRTPLRGAGIDTSYRPRAARNLVASNVSRKGETQLPTCVALGARGSNVTQTNCPNFSFTRLMDGLGFSSRKQLQVRMHWMELRIVHWHDLSMKMRLVKWVCWRGRGVIRRIVHSKKSSSTPQKNPKNPRIFLRI